VTEAARTGVALEINCLPDRLDLNDVNARLARERGARIQYLVGSRGTGNLPDDPLGPASLRRLVPDVRQRDIYICGPIPMMEAVKHNLHQLRVPPAQIHTERFSY
jgi:ferredoxin-NADP reductase